SSRTTSDRCRCRSTETYCRFTGTLLARDRFGLATSSVSLERFRAGEVPFVLVAMRDLQRLAAAGAARRCVSESEAIALSCHHIRARARSPGRRHSEGRSLDGGGALDEEEPGAAGVVAGLDGVRGCQRLPILMVGNRSDPVGIE